MVADKAVVLEQISAVYAVLQELGIEEKNTLLVLNKIDCPEAVHPIVRTHPDTGRKSLFVNRTFTTKIIGLSDSESDAILNMLFEHAEHINYQIRFRWSLNDMAFWDNRCCMHRAIWDYWPEERKGRRVTIKGDRPV